MGFSTPRTPPHHQFPQPTRPRFAADPDQFSDDELITNRPVYYHGSIHHPHVTVDLPKINTKIEEEEVEEEEEEEEHTQQLLLTRAAVQDHHEPPPQPPPASYPPMESSSSSSSSSSSAGNIVVHLSPSTGTTPKGEKEAVDELLLILVDCLNELSTRNREQILMTFFSEVERDERLEKFIVERMKQSKVKALTDLYDRIPPEIKAEAAAAAAEGDKMPPMTRSVVESAEELTEKLERFKIKTLDFEEEKEEEEDVKEEVKDKSQDKPTK